MNSENNLLVRLHKWAARQDENYLTEAFAHLLQHLVEEEPQALAGVLESLTDGFFRVGAAEARAVEVRTQIVTGEGTPDLSLHVLDQLAYVEVKVESIASAQQIRNYRRLLEESGAPRTKLILLTRYFVELESAELASVRCVRWYQVADWLEQERAKYTFKPVGDFLVRQFLGLLRQKGMTMGQVTWELSGGIKALRNFTNMLIEAAHVAGVKVQARGNTTETGVFLEGRDYWVGINFDRPDILVFMTWNRPVEPERAAELEVGEVREWDNAKGHLWRRELDLSAEEVHFFARSRAGQMQLLENFIRESMTIVRRAILSSQATSPDDQPAESA